MKLKISFSLLFCLLALNVVPQTDYSNLNNWAFHPNKNSNLLNNFSLNIAVIDENLNTSTIIQNTNNFNTNTGVDVFFIHPTILQNINSYTTVENISIENQNANMVAASIRGQAGLLAKYGRFYAPRYQQATPPTFLTSPLNNNQATVVGVAYNDVKAAFLNYLANHNDGNKIIIASHSQGAYLAGFLLRDLFDNNPQLLEKLVVAVVAGNPSNYAPQNSLVGGWWQNIPFCSLQEQCGCVISWKTYKEGQIPPIPNSSHPASNPFIASNNWVYNQLNIAQDWFYQDNLYYDSNFSSLENFITLRTNVNFGPTNVGYVAFDDMHQIKYIRASSSQVGFVVEYTPKPNDQRPNLLAQEEINPAFATFGYHQKDYNIYTWALLQQIDQKLNTCTTSLSNPDNNKPINSPYIYPNPTNGVLNLKIDEKHTEFEVAIFNQLGQQVLSIKNQKQIDINNFPNGLYSITIKTLEKTVTTKIIKTK